MLTRYSLAHLLARILSLASGLAIISLVGVSLGNEALGLFGVLTSLQIMLGVFDLGVPTVANFHLAVLQGRQEPWSAQATFIRSLEILFWALAFGFFAAGLFLPGPLVHSWLKIHDLPQAQVERAVMLIAAAVAARFPVTFYTNVCFGLGRHFFPNVIVGAAAVIRVAGSAFALLVLHVGIVGFFWIQLLAAILEVTFLAGGTWWGRSGWHVRPSLRELQGVVGHSSVLSGVSITGVALAQIDKVILSKLLPLGDFGVYSAAYTLASGLLALSYPIGNAVFPALSQSFDQADARRAKTLVQASSEVILFLIVPAGAAVVAQSKAVGDILFLLKGTPAGLVSVLPLMVLGGMAQAYITIPHFCQIAAHRAIVVFWINVGTLPLYAVLTYFATTRWQLAGGALAFLIMNFVRLPVHWLLLPRIKTDNTQRRRLVLMVISVTVTGLAIALALARLQRFGATPIALFFATVVILAVVVAAMLPSVRSKLTVTLAKALQ